MTDYSSTLTIEELRPNGAPGRALILTGSGLPFMGAEWSWKNNLHTDWYPGNPSEATQQNLGPNELPSSWSGDWRRTMLSRTPCSFVDTDGSKASIVQPQIIVKVFETIGRSGYRLRVTWAVDSDVFELSGKIVREGRVANFKQKVTRITDIEWTVQFDWQSRGGAKQSPVSARDSSLAAQLAATDVAAQGVSNATNAMQQFMQTNPQIPRSSSSLTLGQLESLASYPAALSQAFNQKMISFRTKIQQLAQLTNAVAKLPFALQSSTSAAARETVLTANALSDALGQQPAELKSNKRRPSDVTRGMVYFGGMQDANAVFARRATILELQLLTVVASPATKGQLPRRSVAGSSVGRIITVYLTKAGDTPQSISTKFYGNPDHALDIMKANRVPWYQAGFSLGTELVIPVLDGKTKPG